MKPGELFPSAETQERQRRAADPAASAWVSANAGSGKTTVLANRVIRLLLSGVDPSRILCLTFTKAAAANMSNRVFDVLAKWAVASDEDLDRKLEALGEPGANVSLRARARRLFARALDTPGGLKVLTIHGFCERLLHQFPFEAAVPAAFTVLDDRQRDELVAHARAEVLAHAASEDGGALADALTRLVAATSDGSMSRALDELLAKGEALAALMRPDGEDASARVSHRLAAALGLADGETVESINARVVGEAREIASWPEIISWLASGSERDQKFSACFRDALLAADDTTRRLSYLGLCLTKSGTLRSRNALVTKALRASRPDFADVIDEEFERLASLLERRNAAFARERTEALLLVADAIWKRYGIEKARRGALDFADLITATKALIRDAGSAWVHYKLDQGIDHILVDEAQDTSPDQWRIVEGLTAEFTVGRGARDLTRTMFAVGDEKQSIFGFQGAAPAEFGNMRQRYETRHQSVELLFHDLKLTESFRSTADVLGAVDHVFARPEAYRGLSFDDAGTIHETARRDAPGRVDVWPLVKPDERPGSDLAWNAPFDELSERSPVAVLARRIAAAVGGWIDGHDMLGPCAPVSPGGILVLVRSRGALFEAVLRSLKEANIPVAGADRLDVGAHIAVLDLLALADAILLPDDDLQLASVLKSPLFNLDDDDLMQIAIGRSGSLRKALRESPDPRFAEAEANLARWAGAAQAFRPFDFYAALLARDGGRKAFRARLGHEVDDVLDEFLRLAMTYGETETATLSGFAAWMRAASAEIKRDLDVGGSDVRVMTVHGAKGLEASLVVLADLGQPRAPSLAPVIYKIDEPGRREGEAGLLVWSQRKAEDPEALAAARAEEAQREQGEHRRLLYVALTRAADRLVVAGHLGKRSVLEGSWYKLVEDALTEKATDKNHVPAFDGDVLVYRKTPEAVPSPRPAVEIQETEIFPDWLAQPVAQERPGGEWLAPSRALAHNAPRNSELSSTVPAIERGRLLHRLLEELPAVAPHERTDVARRYLARTVPHWPEGERDLAAAEALALINDPELMFILNANGRAEVPVAGEIARGGDRRPILINGRIDLLIVDESRVLIVDFKSDRPAPASPPDTYVAQLALYRAVLRGVFPGRIIEAALLWTSSRRLDRLSPAALDAMLDRVLAMPSVP